ncbi:MAG: glutathione synthase [Myxococcales bacterium]|nr:glutathione synthase [Myxococcales bacterium]
MATSSRGDVLFVLDPLEQLNPRADSSYVMITEALRRGYRPFGVELAGLLLRHNQVCAHAVPLALGPAADGAIPPLVAAGDPQLRMIGEFKVVVMRKDPPVDADFIIATWWLDRARSETLVINEPAGLRDLSEKLAILEFPQLIPRTFLLRNPADLRDALRELGGRMIIKPVYGFGGRGVLIAREDDPNLSTLFELATRDGQGWTIAQEFVPEAKDGDKRILMVDGDPVGAVLRVPAAGELRNNFHMGGRPALAELTPRDRQICARVGPFLRERGQFFVGLDVLGGYLTEINVTSPTGMQEVNRLHDLAGDQTMQAVFWEALERKLQA